MYIRRCKESLGVADVRVKGAIGVVELKESPNLDALRVRFVEKGVWVRPFGNVVYLMPPLTIGTADLAVLVEAVSAVIAELPH
jgi:adenosylmethionine-8-amino-7-oxononanoate aminotransferase